jgi:hypothetical protein
MRTIKFRAWIGDKMEYSVGASRDGGFYCYVDPSDKASLITTIYDRDVPIMQFTGLLDKNGTCKEVYEDDIIDKNGKVIGNKYETPALLKEPTNLLIQGFGTETWEATNREAMGRGCFYAERHASTDEVRELE